MSTTTPQLSPLEQLAAMGQPQQAAPSQPAQQSDLSPLEQLSAMKTPDNLGATPEEQQFLQNNKNYKFLPKDPKFPNREPGVYPAGPGDGWRDDVSQPNSQVSQSPIDLHMLKHTLEGAGEGAAVAGGAVMSPLLLGHAEAFAGTAAGKALIDLVTKHGADIGKDLAKGGVVGIGYEALHKAAKLLGLANEKKD